MRFIKLFFYTIIKTIKSHSHRRISTATSRETSTSQTYDIQLASVSESQRIYSSKDAKNIKKLPTVKVKYVIDGDTVIVWYKSSQIKIRLDSIDCPERSQEWGNIATRGLIKLIGGKSVKLEAHSRDSYGRTVGTIFVYLQDKDEWQNVNEKMVTIGHAWVMRLFYGHLPKSRQKKLNQLEHWAKSKSVGLWRTQKAIPPWEWRKNQAKVTNTT